MITNIIINLEFEATHCWPECPIEEVAFLRSPHRHVFHVQMKRDVAHDDRDVEFSYRGIARAELQEQLAKTAEVVRTVLTDLPEERLLTEYPDVLGGLRTPTGLFLLHALNIV